MIACGIPAIEAATMKMRMMSWVYGMASYRFFRMDIPRRARLRYLKFLADGKTENYSEPEWHFRMKMETIFVETGVSGLFLVALEH